MLTTLTTMLRDDEGATMVEYGLMVALVAIVLRPSLLGTRCTLFTRSTRSKPDRSSRSATTSRTTLRATVGFGDKGSELPRTLF